MRSSRGTSRSAAYFPRASARGTYGTGAITTASRTPPPGSARARASQCRSRSSTKIPCCRAPGFGKSVLKTRSFKASLPRSCVRERRRRGGPREPASLEGAQDEDRVERLGVVAQSGAMAPDQGGKRGGVDRVGRFHARGRELALHPLLQRRREALLAALDRVRRQVRRGGALQDPLAHALAHLHVGRHRRRELDQPVVE